VDLKDILPIVGVAIGWGLSEIAGAVKSRSHRRRSLRKAIYSLYKLNLEILEVKGMQEHIKNESTDLSEWESGRQHAFCNYADNSDQFAKELDDAVMLISEDYPLIAVKLSQYIRKYRYIKKKKLNHFTDDESQYMTLLTGNEVGQLLAQHFIENSILKIAFRVDLKLWLSIKIELKKFKKNIKSGDIVHSSQIIRKHTNNGKTSKT
jgi:hypothetical protein